MKSSVDTLVSILPQWRRSLRADNRQPSTIKTYELAASQLHDYLCEEGFETAIDGITSDSIRGFIGFVLEDRSTATAAQRYRSLQQCFRWLMHERLITEDPMARLRPPKVEEKEVPVLTDAQISLLINTCRGFDFESRRDEAIIRLFLDTGLRLNELSMITLSDLELDAMLVTVRGTGRKRRTVPYSANTGRAIDRYLRVRNSHKDADTAWLWLGKRSPKLSDSGISQMIVRRSKPLGKRIHPHQFRHSWAHAHLMEGGKETDLMRLAGWSSSQMVQRYAASSGMERAHAAARSIALGNRY